MLFSPFTLLTATVMVDVQESPKTLLAILQKLHQKGIAVADSFDARRDPNKHLLKKSKRTVALLDAVAAISIQDARHEIIAVSITLKPNSCVLHIAGNDGVREETLLHLRYIFIQLKSIHFSLAQSSKAGTEKLDTTT